MNPRHHPTQRARGANSARGRSGPGRSPGSPAPGDLPHHLYGLHAVAAALSNPLRRRHRLLVTQNALRRLESLGATPDIEVEPIEASRLTRLLGADAVHQGCLLYCDPLPDLDLDDVISARRLVVLDQVTDPHNVGAILRSAAAFAVEALIMTDRHSPSETAVLAKAAAGAIDVVPVVRVRNLSKALEQLELGGVSTVGLAAEADIGLEVLEIREPFALVMGAEGKGLRQKTRETCRSLGRIDMPGSMPSLNVSNAAALALYVADRKTRPA